MKVRKSESKREQPAPGTYVSRVVGLADLGHQPGFTWSGGEAKDAFKLEITYELVTALMEDGRPFLVSEEMTNSDNEKAKLPTRALAAGIELQDIEQMLTKPVMVTIGPQNEKGYSKITNVSGVPEGIPVKELVNPPTIFDPYAEPAQVDLFNKMPEFKQNKIKSALDFEDMAIYKALLLESDSGDI